jgi:iron complex outermembrane recepter protein
MPLIPHAARTPRRARRLGLVSLAAMAAALAVAPAALAQEAPPADGSDATVEEITVYGERRATNLQETPIAITAVTSEQLEAQTVRNVGDIVDEIPNVARTSGPTGGQDAFFFIRGIGQVDSNPAGDPGVGVYIDDVYLGRIQGASLETLDIAQIEVLRGPQGTLFGRNTIGGAINVITEDPSTEFGGKARFVVGSRDRFEGLFSVDIPTSDRLRSRLSGFYRTQNGWGENAFNGDTYGDVDVWGARLKTVLDLTDTLELTFSADITRSDGSPAQTILAGVNLNAGAVQFPIPGTNPPVFVGTSPLGVLFPLDLAQYISTDPYVSFASIPPINELESEGFSLHADWDLGAVRLKSITAYREVSQFVYNDFDGSPYSFYDNFFDTEQRQFSQEFQLSGEGMDGRLNWLAGVYYFDEHADHNNAICMGTNDGSPPGLSIQPFTGQCLRNNQRFSLDVSSWAVFGNVNFDLTDRLTINAGLRYTDETKEQDYNFFIDNTAGVFSFFGFPPFSFPTIVASVEDSWSSFTPKVGLDFKASEDLFLYASYARGFKSGGFDGRPIPGSPIQSYDPEEIDTFEVGFKSDLWDRRLRLNGAVFFSKYTDIQLLVVDPGSGFFVLTNAGDSDIWGAELELTARPTEQLLIQASVGWMHDEYSELAPGAAFAGIDLDDSLPLTPEFTASLAVQYTVPTPIGELALRGDYSFRSEVAFGAPNEPLEIGDDLGLLNLRATLDLNDQVSVSLFGLNVTDETYIANAQDVRGALGVAFQQIGAPAEWGAEVRLKF